jgi:RNA polymerase sigma factor (sigma-70 family)
MNSGATSRYDQWIAQNYAGLLKYARRYHKHPHDLLHEVYLRIRKMPHLDRILEGKPWGYHILAMFRQAKMGKFAKTYLILDHVEADVPEVHEVQRVLCREQVDLVLSRLDWFDRTLFQLKLDGQSLTELAEESGISCHTIYYSIRKTTKILKNHFDDC